jgi:type II secretory pathway pseudopilin PulG
VKGFTLIELTMIMVIMVLTLFVMLNKIPDVDVAQQAKRLQSDLRYIKFLAQTQNQRTRIDFSTSSYTLTMVTGSTPIVTPNSTSNVVTLISGVSMSSTNAFLVFDGLGRPYSDAATPGTLLSSTATITLTNGTDTSTVTVTPDTGEIQ